MLLTNVPGQDNLHSGPESPISLAAGDITALLPGSEEEFARGQEPASRAALEDTPPAIENSKLISDPRRSLFATLIQTHYFWGRVSRRAVKYDRSSRPWEDTSEYHELVQKLHEWEANLPHEHMWSPVLLKGYKASCQDLVSHSKADTKLLEKADIRDRRISASLILPDFAILYCAKRISASKFSVDYMV